MDQAQHLHLNNILVTAMQRNVIDGTSTVQGIYRHESTTVAMRLPELGKALGSFAGYGGEIGQRLTGLAERIERGEITVETRWLLGIALILEVHIEDAPMHLLTAVCNDRTVHRIGWSRDETSPTGLVLPPEDHSLDGDPFVTGTNAILNALIGGERA